MPMMWDPTPLSEQMGRQRRLSGNRTRYCCATAAMTFLTRSDVIRLFPNVDVPRQVLLAALSFLVTATVSQVCRHKIVTHRTHAAVLFHLPSYCANSGSVR